MSVLIKGMDMPERCGQCFLRVGNCKQRIYMEQRPKGCPLVEIPIPHGQLIDVDELVRIWRGAKIYGDIEPIVNARPTVIEAEER